MDFTLQLAGAQNLDVEFARQRLIEAEGAYASERLRFFPTLAPGIGYRRHDGRIQDTGGDILDVSKQSGKDLMVRRLLLHRR